MVRRACAASVVVLFCSLVLPSWAQQYYLYEPRPVTVAEKGLTKDGVLVTEVSVQKGDTLYDISRKFNSRGMYYPQILLFNKIKNPNLIYPGNILRVPVTQGGILTESAPVKTSPVKPKQLKVKAGKGAEPKEADTVQKTDSSNLNSPDKAKKSKTSGKGGSKDKKGNAAVSGKTKAGSNPVRTTAAGQKLFDRAAKAYRQNNFRTALELFDRFLAENANSPLAADASLYKAECYLKLSSQ